MGHLIHFILHCVLLFVRTTVVISQNSAIPPLPDQPSATVASFVNNSSSTIPDSASPPSQTPSPFTRANVFGVFITIQLCQLTQPYGSLLVRVVNGWFWRISPIASFVEGCIIITHLLLSRDEPLRSRRGFRVVAAALLLVRGNREDEVEEHERVDLLPASAPQASDANSAGAEEAGSGQMASSSENDPSPPAFDGTSMAHKEWRISLFTMLSVVFVFIKMCAVRGVPCFTAAMVGLLFGWSTVQSLLLLLNWRDLTHNEETHAKELARKLRKSIRETNAAWQVLFVVLHLPIFGYPAWYLAFQFALPPALHFANSILSFLYAVFCRLVAVASFTYILATIFIGCMMLSSCDFERLPLELGLLLGSPIVMWLMFAGLVDSNTSSDLIDNPTYQRIFTHPFRNIIRSFFLLLVFLGQVSFFSIWVYKAPHAASAINFFLTTILFVAYLVRYESTGTIKPDWTEWLG